eukprot:1190254-Prorocentrum_minimum.AAC.4
MLRSAIVHSVTSRAVVTRRALSKRANAPRTRLPAASSARRMHVIGIVVDVIGIVVDVIGIVVDVIGIGVDVIGVVMDVIGVVMDVIGIVVNGISIGVDGKSIGVDGLGIARERTTNVPPGRKQCVTHVIACAPRPTPRAARLLITLERIRLSHQSSIYVIYGRHMSVSSPSMYWSQQPLGMQVACGYVRSTTTNWSLITSYEDVREVPQTSGGGLAGTHREDEL